MANRIAGITVEIGGDTTKLSTALKSVNSEIKSTQSQLRDVNKLLKLDPGNTELITQKHKLLAQAVSETKQKLEQLKTAAEQANEKLKTGEITQQQYDALQREIVETEQKLKDLESQASKSQVALQKIAQVGDKMKTFGDNLSSVGTSLTRNVTTPIVGVSAAAVKTAADFDSAMSEVSAISGATGSDFDALREKARELGSKTKFSATEAAQGMTYMSMAGWKTADMLDGIEGVMNLAAASGEDLAVTSDIVTDALTAFGLSAKDSGHFSDILAAASSNANTNVSMMGETFKYCAPIAGSLGYSAEDVAVAIGLLGNAGIKSSQAGTTLRKMMTELTGELEISGKAFGDVKIQTENADGSMKDFSQILSELRVYFGKMTEAEQASTAEMLVGKTAMSGLLALMNAAPSDIDKLTKAIDNCDGSAEKMASVMQDNLAGQLTILKSQLQELAISFGDILVPVIRDVVTHIQNLVDKFNQLDPHTKELIVKIGLIVAAVGPVLIIVGKVISAIGTIMSILPALGGVISTITGGASALFAVLAANPIGLVVAAIAALIAIFVTLWNKCDGFREFWINLWENVKSIFNKAWEGMKSVFSAVIDFIKSNWQGLLLFLVNPVAGAFKLIYDNCESFRRFWDNFLEGVKNVFTSIWEGIKKAFTTIAEAIKTVAKESFEQMKNIIQTTLEAIKTVCTTVWNAIKTVIETAIKNIASFVKTAWEGIKNTISSVMEAIHSVISRVWESIKSTTQAVLDFLKELITSAWNAIKETITSIMESIKSTLIDAWNTIKSTVTSVVNAIRQTVVSAWESMKNSIISIMENIKSTVTNIWNALKSAVESIVNALKDMIINTWNNVKDTLTNIVNNIKDTVSNAFNTLVDTMGNILSKVTGVVKSGFQGAIDFITSLPSQALKWGSDIIGNLINGIKSKIGELASAAKQMANTISEYVHFSEPDKGPLSNFHTFMPDMIDLMCEGIEGNLGMLKGPMSDLAKAIIPGQDAMASMQIKNGQSNEVKALTQVITKYLPMLANKQIVLDSGTLVGELSDGINRQLGKAYL